MPSSKTLHPQLDRRDFLKALGGSATACALSRCAGLGPDERVQPRRPNLVYVFADQWRAQATGYGGDPNVHTPNLDRLAQESIDFTHAVSGCPVCTPYRASLLTGQYPLTHGLFLNDLCLGDRAVTLAHVYARAGYDTAYIGKWHLDGHGRSAFIPAERRQGFDYWKVLECTHRYNRSGYYTGSSQEKKTWEGYDAIAQTLDAQQYVRDHALKEKPFILFLSLGPPHNPYQTAPEQYRDQYPESGLKLRPNVPKEARAGARKDLAGYYAHITALDDCIGDLLNTIQEAGMGEDTIFVFTSDHGDMLGSQGMQRKQKPWDESIRVPFLLRYPRILGRQGRVIDMPINTPDIMPTLLGLSGVGVPSTVEGTDYSGVIRDGIGPWNDAALITCVAPFGEWGRGKGREYRGIRTCRYTYVQDLKGPWLLYDNEQDPYQMKNLVHEPGSTRLKARLEALLAEKLEERKDAFLTGEEYIRQRGFQVNQTGTVPYTN